MFKETQENPGYIEESQEKKRESLLRKFDRLYKKYPKVCTLVYLLSLEGIARVGINKSVVEVPSLITADIKQAYSNFTSQEGPKINKYFVPEVTENEVVRIKGAMKKIGGNAFYIETAKSAQTEEERKEYLEADPSFRVYGFENTDQFSNEEIQEHIKQFPRGFQKNINVINYQHSLDEGTSTIPGATSEGARLILGHALKNNTIKIYNHTGSTVLDHKSTINHEVFHLQDWGHNGLLTLQERLDLLDEVINRVQSPDRFKSEYVEGITHDDKKKELSRKAEEYWAEIGEAYMSENYAILPQADRELIESVIKKTDPNFDRAKTIAALKEVK